MISGLVSIIRELHGDRQTGMLTLNADGANSLFKMYFKEGDIYHIAYQDTQNSQCLDLIDILDFNSCGFLPKVKLNRRRQNLPTTAEIIRYCEMSAETITTSRGRIVDAECIVEKTDIRPIVEDDEDSIETVEDGNHLFEDSRSADDNVKDFFENTKAADGTAEDAFDNAKATDENIKAFFEDTKATDGTTEDVFDDAKVTDENVRDWFEDVSGTDDIEPATSKEKPASKDEASASSTRITFERAKEIQDELTLALVRQIGPVGKKITQNIITEKWKPFSPKNPTTKDCKALVEMLISEIEDIEYQEEFRKESSLILNL